MSALLSMIWLVLLDPLGIEVKRIVELLVEKNASRLAAARTRCWTKTWYKAIWYKVPIIEPTIVERIEACILVCKVLLLL